MLLWAGKTGEGVGRLRERELAGTYNGTKSDEDAHGRCGLSTLNTGARDVPRMFKDPRFCLDDGRCPRGGRPETDGGDFSGHSRALHHFLGREKEKEKRRNKTGGGRLIEREKVGEQRRYTNMRQ